MLRPALMLPVIIMAGALAGCGGADGADKAPAAKPAAAPLAVIVTPVSAAATAARQRVSGTVRARREGNLSFGAPGRIAAIRVDEGDAVRRGQVLATLDLSEVTAGAAAARAELARAEAELARNRSLLAQGWVTRARVDASEAAAAAARAAVAARSFSASTARIIAPADGVVLARLAEAGQIISPGSPVLSVSQTGGGYVLRVALTDAQVVGLRLGQTMPVLLPALPGTELAGRVVQIAGRADDRTGTFAADLALAGPGTGALRSGMIGEAALALPAPGPAMVAIAPSALWQARAGEGFVFIVDDQNIARARRVTLGRVDDAGVEVLAGLAAGERIVTGGIDRVRDGMTVKPNPAARP